MKINVDHLTPEEIELIQQHREKQKTLVLTHEVTDTGYCYEFKEMRFSMTEDVVHLVTKKQKNLDGKFYSSNGFFESNLTKEEAKRVRDFLDVFLQQTNPTV